ncbi:MAG: hypothetical protein C0467_23810 [Planctomycetaceae bacterium]|nr:hypothetical protein [Planctomycetaceae bacterium]
MTSGGEREERRHQAAVQVALRTGLLRRCSIHDAIFDPGQYDFQGASMTASFLINQSDALVADFDGDRSLLLERLKSICKTYPRACPQCNQPAQPAS